MRAMKIKLVVLAVSLWIIILVAYHLGAPGMIGVGAGYALFILDGI